MTSTNLTVSMPVHSKEMLSTRPTHFLPPDSNTFKPIHRSIDLKRSQSQKALDIELKRKDEILENCIKDVKKKIFYRTINPEYSIIYVDKVGSSISSNTKKLHSINSQELINRIWLDLSFPTLNCFNSSTNLWRENPRKSLQTRQ